MLYPNELRMFFIINKMVYILNTEISEKKIVKIALENIFGIGRQKAIQICLFIGISKKTKIKELSAEIKNKIILYIENNIKIGDDLRQILTQIKENQIKIKCYRGQRAKHKLPRRGQRTHTNSQTVKKIT
jgi:small subunit ribosomal protein S13